MPGARLTEEDVRAFQRAFVVRVRVRVCRGRRVGQTRPDARLRRRRRRAPRKRHRSCVACTPRSRAMSIASSST